MDVLSDKNWELELNEYIRQGEPDKVDRSNAWKTAIGLQDVDGLKPSEYLIETAKEHIEGKITISEADKRIQSYYEERQDRSEIEVDTKEADIVSVRIAKLLGERRFSFHQSNGRIYIANCLRVYLSMLVKYVIIILQKKNGYLRVIP